MWLKVGHHQQRSCGDCLLLHTITKDLLYGQLECGTPPIGLGVSGTPGISGTRTHARGTFSQRTSTLILGRSQHQTAPRSGENSAEEDWSEHRAWRQHTHSTSTPRDDTTFICDDSTKDYHSRIYIGLYDHGTVDFVLLYNRAQSIIFRNWRRPMTCS